MSVLPLYVCTTEALKILNPVEHALLSPIFILNKKGFEIFRLAEDNAWQKRSHLSKYTQCVLKGSF
jgi:hypothetical protein